MLSAGQWSLPHYRLAAAVLIGVEMAAVSMLL